MALNMVTADPVARKCLEVWLIIKFIKFNFVENDQIVVDK